MESDPHPAAMADSDTSDSDVEELEVEPADMEALIKLEADLSANPNLYDSHIQVCRGKQDVEPDGMVICMLNSRMKVCMLLQPHAECVSSDCSTVH